MVQQLRSEIPLLRDPAVARGDSRTPCAAGEARQRDAAARGDLQDAQGRLRRAWHAALRGRHPAAQGLGR
eukprot:4576753-Prymnesium_polylepis.1